MENLKRQRAESPHCFDLDDSHYLVKYLRRSICYGHGQVAKAAFSFQFVAKFPYFFSIVTTNCVYITLVSVSYFVNSHPTRLNILMRFVMSSVLLLSFLTASCKIMS